MKIKKLAADKLEEFTHPCGGSGWKLVIYRDFRNTPCPDELEQTMHPERPYTCGKKSEGAGCDYVFFTETDGLEYSKVCGCIKAYQFGTTSASDGVELFSTSPSDLRIWSFYAGITQSQPSVESGHYCPCDGGVQLGGILGEIHFCESLVKDETPGNKYDNHFF